MPHDLPQQGLGHRFQINQVNGAAGALCQGFDDGYLLGRSQCLAGCYGDVEVAVRALTTQGNRTKQHRQ